MLLTLVNQILFTSVGLALLLTIVKKTPLVDTMLAGLAASVVIPSSLSLCSYVTARPSRTSRR